LSGDFLIFPFATLFGGGFAAFGWSSIVFVSSHKISTTEVKLLIREVLPSLDIRFLVTGAILGSSDGARLKGTGVRLNILTEMSLGQAKLVTGEVIDVGSSMNIWSGCVWVGGSALSS
jgi:hypothetical protein